MFRSSEQALNSVDWAVSGVAKTKIAPTSFHLTKRLINCKLTEAINKTVVIRSFNLKVILLNITCVAVFNSAFNLTFERTCEMNTKHIPQDVNDYCSEQFFKETYHKYTIFHAIELIGFN